MQITIGAVIVLAASGAIIWYILYREKIKRSLQQIAPYFQQPEEVREFDDPAMCQRILACQCIDEPGPKNTLFSLESRANPNQRLVQVFGIHNAFTTYESKYHLDFKARALGILGAVDDKRWKGIAHIARKLIHRRTERQGRAIDPEGGIPFVTFVQTVAMSISLYVLFDSLNPLELDESNVSKAAGCINELWIQSKKDPIDDKLVSAEKSILQEALHNISPDFEFKSDETPLNLILPAYETLWRVVLRCFIEVSFLNRDSTQEWREVLQRFLENPADSAFKERTVREDVSVEFIVFEALRLYPPTRRVYREFKFGNEENSETVAADIEKSHRNPKVWGPESELFRPSRWNNISDELRKKIFMAFGGGRFICPAQKKFGPKMIGILVAALATEIYSDGWKIGSVDKYGSVIDHEWARGPLESGREAFGSLKLWRKSSSAGNQA